MKGITNKPYIDCDSHLDINGLTDLHDEICVGIAQSKILTAVLPSAKNHLDRYVDPNEKNEIFKQFISLPREAGPVYLKLKTGWYCGSSVVYIRDMIDNSWNAFENKRYASKTKWHENSNLFPGLKVWLESLPFKEIGRVLFWLTENDCDMYPHRDNFEYKEHSNEFIWFNPTKEKRFYIYDEGAALKIPVNSSSAFFNDLDVHGVDRADKLQYTLRVDGIFTDEFRKQLGINSSTY